MVTVIKIQQFQITYQNQHICGKSLSSTNVKLKHTHTHTHTPHHTTPHHTHIHTHIQNEVRAAQSYALYVMF